MKTTTLFTSLITATLLASSPVFAGSFGAGNGDLYGHIVLDLDKPAFVGTSMAIAKTRVDAYNGFTTGNSDIDQSGFAIGSTGPEKGHVDTYGWAVLDVSR
jgi:hypothetical protein